MQATSAPAHDEAVLPGAVHRVIYEALVETPQLRRAASRTGWTCPSIRPDCAFSQTQGHCNTCSEQVRQPIFTDGLDHWRNFEPWLPLKAELGPALESWPFRGKSPLTESEG